MSKHPKTTVPSERGQATRQKAYQQEVTRLTNIICEHLAYAVNHFDNRRAVRPQKAIQASLRATIQLDDFVSKHKGDCPELNYVGWRITRDVANCLLRLLDSQHGDAVDDEELLECWGSEIVSYITDVWNEVLWNTSSKRLRFDQHHLRMLLLLPDFACSCHHCTETRHNPIVHGTPETDEELNLLDVLGMTRSEAQAELLRLAKSGVKRPRGPLGKLSTLYTTKS